MKGLSSLGIASGRAIQFLLYLNLHPGVGRTSPVRQQLQGAAVVLDSVVPGHLAAVFEAQDSIEGD